MGNEDTGPATVSHSGQCQGLVDAARLIRVLKRHKAELLADNKAAMEHRDKALEQRDAARANYQFMVDRAANEKLDGYRDLGARAARAENDRDDARRQRDANLIFAQSAEERSAEATRQRNEALRERDEARANYKHMEAEAASATMLAYRDKLVKEITAHRDELWEENKQAKAHIRDLVEERDTARKCRDGFEKDVDALTVKLGQALREDAGVCPDSQSRIREALTERNEALKDRDSLAKHARILEANLADVKTARNAALAETKRLREVVSQRWCRVCLLRGEHSPLSHSAKGPVDA